MIHVKRSASRRQSGNRSTRSAGSRTPAVAACLLCLALAPSARGQSTQGPAGTARDPASQQTGAAPEGPAANGTGLGLRFDAGYLYDDNVTRAKSPDRLYDQSLSVNLGKNVTIPVTDFVRVLVTGFVGGEKFNRYEGLSRVSVGAQADLQYRSSGEFSKPTFSLFAQASADMYDSVLRDGSRNSIGVSVLQPVTDRIQIFAAVAHNERYGESAVFNNRDNSVRANLDWTLGARGTLYLGAEYRDGDIVSTGRPTLEIVDIAKVLVADDAFPGRGFFSYKFEGRTVLTTAGYNLAVGQRSSLDFTWRRAEATPSQRPSFATSARSYIVNQFSLVFLTSF